MLLEPAPGVELLDDPGAAPDVVCRSLRDIARANRWFGGAAAVRWGLRRLFAGARPSARPLTLLDIGTGTGDLPRMAAAWAARRGVQLVPVGLERHAAAARLAHAGGLPTLLGDAGALPLRDRGVDVVLMSQVAHHFAPGAVVRLLRECDRVARLGVVVADLHRSRLAAAGFRLAGSVLGFHPVTVADGVTSLARGFTPGSLAALLIEAGIRGEVARRPGSRLVAVWRPA